MQKLQERGEREGRRDIESEGMIETLRSEKSAEREGARGASPAEQQANGPVRSRGPKSANHGWLARHVWLLMWLLIHK